MTRKPGVGRGGIGGDGPLRRGQGPRCALLAVRLPSTVRGNLTLLRRLPICTRGPNPPASTAYLRDEAVHSSEEVVAWGTSQRGPTTVTLAETRPGGPSSQSEGRAAFPSRPPPHHPTLQAPPPSAPSVPGSATWRPAAVRMALGPNGTHTRLLHGWMAVKTGSVLVSPWGSPHPASRVVCPCSRSHATSRRPCSENAVSSKSNLGTTAASGQLTPGLRLQTATTRSPLETLKSAWN